MKNTKKALFTSFVSLLLCFTMLVGSTFAWFTDTATTNVNSIVAGTLDLVLVKADGSAFTEGETLDFVSADPAGQPEEILWEPGAAYVTNGFRIKNNGNLAFKFKVVITDTGKGDVELLDVIKFDLVSKAPDETDYTVYNGAEVPVLPDEGKNVDETVYYLRGTMDTAAGNEYADLTLEGVTITVYATQYTHEYDSEDDQYDLGALYADGTGGTTNPEPDPNPGEGEGEGTTIDRDALNNAIASAKTYIDAGNNNKYTAESWDTLTGAYEKAINVAADADQDTVDAAANELAAAISNLATLSAKTVTVKYVFDDGTTKADYTLTVNPGETGKAVPDAEGINTAWYIRSGADTVDYETAPESVTVTYTYIAQPATIDTLTFDVNIPGLDNVTFTLSDGDNVLKENVSASTTDGVGTVTFSGLGLSLKENKALKLTANAPSNVTLNTASWEIPVTVEIPDGEKDYKATAAAVEAKTGYTRTILSDSFDDAVETGVNASDDWMRTITTQNGANKYIPGEQNQILPAADGDKAVAFVGNGQRWGTQDGLVSPTFAMKANRKYIVEIIAKGYDSTEEIETAEKEWDGGAIVIEDIAEDGLGNFHTTFRNNGDWLNGDGGKGYSADELKNSADLGLQSLYSDNVVAWGYVLTGDIDITNYFTTRVEFVPKLDYDNGNVLIFNERNLFKSNGANTVYGGKEYNRLVYSPYFYVDSIVITEIVPNP